MNIGKSQQIYDKFFKDYATEFPEHFFSMIFGKKVEKEDIKIEKTEISIKTRYTDYVFRYKNIYYHFEFQLRYKKGYEENLFSYNAVLKETLKKGVISVVVYIKKHRKKPPNYYEVKDKFGLGIRFEFSSFELADYRDYIEKNPYLAPVKIILAKKKDKEILKQIKDDIDKGITKDEAKNNLYALLYIIGNKYFGYKFLTNLFGRRSMETLKEFPLVKEWIKEGIKEGREEGIKEGREEGIKEGIKEGKRLAILNLLEIRFKHVPQKIKREINKIDDVKVLDKILKKVVTLKSLDELKKQYRKKTV